MRSLVLRSLVPAALVAFAATTGCAAPSESEDEAAEGAVAFTEADAACHAEAPRGGESKTEAYARCLTLQADRVLDAQIARAEDPRDRALAAYKGKLRLPAETGCFTEDVPGGFTGVWQNDIDSRRDVGELAVQIKATVDFLKHFHRALDGYPNNFFERVEICPNGQVGGDLALVGGRLRIGVRTGFFGRVGIHAEPKLTRMWNDGEHLTGALEGFKGLRWTVLDPIGTPRTVMRAALRRLTARLSGTLGGLEGKPTEQVRTELARLVREETSEVAGPEGQASIRERALAKIATMTGAQLTRLAKAWRLEIGKGEVSEGVEDGAASLHDVMQSRDVRVEVTQRGFINIQNYKQISVDAQAFLPRASFSKYVEAVRTETTVKVEQEGFLNIQLNDVIDVKAQLFYGRAAQTASLDRVLGP